MNPMKRKAKIQLGIKIGILVSTLVIVCAGVLFENRSFLWNEEPQLFFKVGKEIVKPWNNGEVYYVFLPSFADKENVRLTAYSEKIKWSDGEIKKGASLKELPTDEILSCVRVKGGQPYQLCVMQSANLSTVFVNTNSGDSQKLRASKEYEESAQFCMIDEKGREILTASLKSINGRGNTSFNSYEKKPWNIEFDKKQKLFDKEAEQKYVLVSNGSDPTLVRNDLMRRMEKAMEIPYTEIGEFVDLYLNGEYQGNYYLCEPVRVGAQRISITNMEKKMEKYLGKAMLKDAAAYETEGRKALNLPALDAINDFDFTGGYLLERDYIERYEKEYENTPSSFRTKDGECFVVKSPKYCSAKQIDYIASFVEQVENAILSREGIDEISGKTYEQLLDTESFAKRYLAEEISKNFDAGVSSMYFYKDSDNVDARLFLAPGWDYDMCLGNYKDWMADVSESPEGLTRLTANDGSSDWFDALYEKEDYRALVKEYYWQFAHPFLEKELPELISRYREELGASTKLNHCRWENDLKEHVYYTDVDAAFAILEQYANDRMTFLDNEWKD